MVATSARTYGDASPASRSWYTEADLFIWQVQEFLYQTEAFKGTVEMAKGWGRPTSVHAVPEGE